MSGMYLRYNRWSLVHKITLQVGKPYSDSDSTIAHAPTSRPSTTPRPVIQISSPTATGTAKENSTTSETTLEQDPNQEFTNKTFVLESVQTHI